MSPVEKNWMKHLVIFPLLLLIAASCWGEEAQQSPESLVRGFYGTCFKVRPVGLPTEGQLKMLSPYFSSELTSLFEKARRCQADYMERYPDDKPPLIEGDLFSSLFEGPSGFEVGPAEKRDQRYRVPVRFSRVDPESPKDVVRWEDAVIVKRQGSGFVIEDFEFLGHWPFKIGDRLSDVLRNLE
jgi:hypothetical protein